MKNLLASITFLLFVSVSYSQNDTIFTGNDRIACTVREVTEDGVKFSYPDEELLNTIYKNSVLKIKFKSGREQIFSEAASYKKVNGHQDFERVTFTQVESEVRGLFNLGNVSSKAEGATGMSNMGRVKMTATKKIQIEAAMHGANIIYLTQNDTKQATRTYNTTMPTYTTMTGVAYSNTIPNFNDFMSLVGKKKKFMAFERVKLWTAGVKEEVDKFNKSVSIDKIENENGLIFVKGTVDGVKGGFDKFRVISFDDKSFILFYKDKSNIYNIKVNI